jgi:hypothetical protein
VAPATMARTIGAVLFITGVALIVRTLWSAPSVTSHADGCPNALQVLVDVREQAELDELLGRHGWRIGEDALSSLPWDRQRARARPGVL